jgi:hypothetical protein
MGGGLLTSCVFEGAWSGSREAKEEEDEAFGAEPIRPLSRVPSLSSLPFAPDLLSLACAPCPSPALRPPPSIPLPTLAARISMSM